MADERFVVLTEEMVVALLKKYDPLTQSILIPPGPDLVVTTSAKAIMAMFHWLSHGRDLGKVKTMPNDE